MRDDLYDEESRFNAYRGVGPKNYRRADPRIAEEINERLTDDPYVDATDIDVSVEDGIVHLKGTVRSRNEKRRADDIAGYCRGVRDVMNALRVAQRDEEMSIGKSSE